MEFSSRYQAKIPNAKGIVDYSAAENLVWDTLYSRQSEILAGIACDEFIRGVDLLQLTPNNIPQLPDVSTILQKLTGWQVVPVQALISPREFFTLLSEQKFPAATFVRVLEELDYVTEPDIFHELFGHCPMLTEPVYADFIRRYAELALSLPEKEWPLLQRLFWFTVEFGLVNTKQGLRAYGGGILSSYQETLYCVNSEIPQRKPFDPLDALRTPYRIDMLQHVYFVIDDYQQLYDYIQSDVAALLQQAHQLGEFEPMFPVDPDNPNIHIFAC